MNDDRFFERVRNDAGQLRYEPDDDVMWSRLAARVRERVQLAPRPTVAELLAGWLRPLAASVAALMVFTALAAGYVAQNSRDSSAAAIDSISASADFNTTIDDVYGFAE